jgi:predicted secreted protein
MSGFLNFAVYLVIVFVAAYALCAFSAHCAMDDLVKAEWEALTKEQQANEELRLYFASTQADYAGLRRYAIMKRNALRFAIRTTVAWCIVYVVLAGTKL